MKFSGQHDIDVPIEAVFDMLSEYGRFERYAIRRGVEVHRAEQSASGFEGMIWDTAFTVRGKPRRMQVRLLRFDRPNLMRFEATGKGVDGDTLIELAALSLRRTRVSVEMSLEAKTLPARLLLQSLKLGRARLRRQFQVKLAEFSGKIEKHYIDMR